MGAYKFSVPGCAYLTLNLGNFQQLFYYADLQCLAHSFLSSSHQMNICSLNGFL